MTVPGVHWELDPTATALLANSANDGLPDAFCLDIGRRLLLAEVQFGEWVLRRVEKIAFESDRGVSRRCSVELMVRPDAPVFEDRAGRRYWLVPLSLMRRQTLVNFDLRDEHGESVTMPGIRLAQRLDESILLAAAEAAGADATDAGLRSLVHDLVAGRKNEVIAAMAALETGEPAADPAFLRRLHRLRYNFSLYVFLPEDAGPHRLLWMSFDEPTDWRFRRPVLRTPEDGPATYEPGHRVGRWERGQLLAGFGLIPTRVRFQTPAAENATSYHVEVTAPPGVQIVQASLLAGRPNDPGRHVSVDHVRGNKPVVGLHALEVPNGSLCRAQVELAVPSRGWLTAMVLSCWLILGVPLSVATHWSGDWPSDKLTNVVVLLLSTSAGVLTLVSQRDEGGVAARLVSRLRAVGTVATALPVVLAGLITYGNLTAGGDHLQLARVLVWVLSAVAAAAALLLSLAWWRSSREERRTGERSPWTMTDDSPAPVHTDYLAALAEFRFDTPAVSIRSAEGWHERYAWDDELEQAAMGRLAPDRCGSTCHDLFGCAVRRRTRVAG